MGAAETQAISIKYNNNDDNNDNNNNNCCQFNTLIRLIIYTANKRN